MKALALILLILAGITLPASAARPADPFVPFLRLWQQAAPLVAPPCAPPVSTTPVANYVEPGESKYQLAYLTANAAGTICVQVAVNGTVAQRTCAPTCNASPCLVWAPVVGPPGTLEELSVTLTGEGPPACYFPAIAWDFQLATGP